MLQTPLDLKGDEEHSRSNLRRRTICRWPSFCQIMRTTSIRYFNLYPHFIYQSLFYRIPRVFRVILTE